MTKKNDSMLGPRVKQARRQLNLTQKQLGKISGLSQQTITKIENREIAWPRKFDQLVSCLRVPREWLMFGQNAPGWSYVEELPNRGVVEIRDTIPIAGRSTDLTIDPKNVIGHAKALSTDPDSYCIEMDIQIGAYRPGNLLVCEPSAALIVNDDVLMVHVGENQGASPEPIKFATVINETENDWLLLGARRRQIHTRSKPDIKFIHKILCVMSPTAKLIEPPEKDEE